ncbi:MAG: SusD/RagB family nutrient-binding outer membrane lipoprotein [Bacteroidales bacterium]|nr:SusD/RagB family nutrient-binding outer membrane lipoprotein [Bacteroidales bacterium]
MKKLIYIISIVVLLFTLSGCESWLDVNQDPTRPTDVSLPLALSPGISSSAYVFGGWWQILGGIWAQHWTQSTGASQYRNMEDYQMTPSDFDWQWSEIFAGGLNDLEKVRNEAMEQEDWNYYLIATAVQSWTWAMLVDCFDQLPFSEALQADLGILNPHYDNGQDIYDELIDRIDFALEQDLSAVTSTAPGADALLFTSMDDWVAFANTVKLRMYLRQVYARPSVAEDGITEMINDEVDFLISDDAAMTQFIDQQDRRNPVYETGIDRLSGNISASGSVVNFLIDNADARVDVLYNRPVDDPSAHNALTQGDYRADEPTNISGLSTPALTATDPVFFFSVEQVNFMLAEVYARWPSLGNAGDDKLYYDAAVTANLERHGLGAQVDAYIGVGGLYEYNSAGSLEEKLEQIIVQKWISMVNTQGVEAWLEFNRTHYPNLAPSVSSILPAGEMPKRFLWSSDERGKNENVPPLPDVNDKVWWDTKE